MNKRYLPLIGTALAAASLFRFSLPAFAAGTSAGQGLVNKATATYKDGDENEYEAISNEVTVTVGKVAGITNVANGNSSTGTILPGQALGFDFRITNTGNDVSSIFIPDTSTISAYSGTTDNLTVTSVTFRRSNETTFTNREDLTNGIVTNVAEDDFIIVRVNVTVDTGLADGTEIAVQLGNTGDNDPLDDATDDTQNQPDEISGSPDTDTDDVRTVTATGDSAAGGSTPTDTRNVTTDPVNGQREASAINSVNVGARPLALPQITKVDGGTDNNTTPSVVTDDVITYNLGLNVLSSGLTDYTSPNFNFSVEDFEGRDYSSATSTEDGTTAVFNTADFGGGSADFTNLILVTDAIPVGTSLNLNGAGTGGANVAAPTGWTAVYSNSPLSVPADEAIWRTDITALPGTDLVTRIGWVYDASDDASGVIDQGTSIASGDFSFQVVTDGVTTATANIYNLAQVFGSTDDGAAGTTTGSIVFDESGDPNPSNFNDDGSGRVDETIATTVDETAVGVDLNGDGDTADTAVPVFGYADPGTGEDNVDPGNNTGTGPAGEVNKVTVSTVVAATSAILNGPDAAADAVGKLFLATSAAADDNHDYQNKGAATPTDILDSAYDTDGNVIKVYDPDPTDGTRIFNNTVQNNGSAAYDATIEPINPGYAGVGGSDDTLVNGGSLPDGTIVFIQLGGQTVQYTYDRDGGTGGTGTFNLTGGGTTATVNGASVTLASASLTTGTINVNDTVDYTVIIDLPDDTPLSTNFVDVSDPGAGVYGGYAVPIIAYVDEDTAGFNAGADVGATPGDATTGASAVAGETVELHNLTINQVYTGFLQLEKTAKIFGVSDPSDPTDTTIVDVTSDTSRPIPGDIIQYDITYTNISDDESSGESSNVLLTADDLIITEDGTTGGATTSNNWGLDNDGDGIIDTLHVLGEAGEVNTGTDELVSGSTIPILYGDGTSTNPSEAGVTGEIIEYRYGGNNGIDGIAPGDSGTFRFQRKVTEESDSGS